MLHRGRLCVSAFEFLPVKLTIVSDAWTLYPLAHLSVVISDFLVLPEGAVAAVRHRASAEKLLPPQNGPAEQWQRLSVLLKLLWEATDCWGSPVNLCELIRSSN